MRLKKVAAMFTAVVLTISVFAACGGSGSEEDTGGSSSSGTTSDGEDSGGQTEDGGETDDGDHAAPVITLPGSTEESKAFSNRIKNVGETWIDGLFADNRKGMRDLAQSWLDEYTAMANQDGVIEPEEQAMIADIGRIQDYIDETGLDLTHVKIEENALNDSLHTALTDMVASGTMEYVNNGDALLIEIIRRMEILEGWPKDCPFYIDIISATAGVDSTAKDMAEKVLKQEAIGQVLDDCWFRYQTGVVPIVEDGKTYYAVLIVAIEQRS